MKLEKQFFTKDNVLYTLDERVFDVIGSPVLNASDCVTEQAAQSVSDISCINLNWTQVGCDEDSYNEEFLAGFRDFLKVLDDKKKFAFIVPVADKSFASDSDKDAFVASMKHCARRIKDCSSVVGFAVPSVQLEVDSAFFMEELSAKHKHYVFFSHDDEILKDSSIVKY